MTSRNTPAKRLRYKAKKNLVSINRIKIKLSNNENVSENELHKVSRENAYRATIYNNIPIGDHSRNIPITRRVSKVQENYKEDRCPVCLSQSDLDAHCFYSCGHAICSSCLKEQIDHVEKKNASVITCGICRNTVKSVELSESDCEVFAKRTPTTYTFTMNNPPLNYNGITNSYTDLTLNDLSRIDWYLVMLMSPPHVIIEGE
jgi:hypothetical protein|tara:strand:+ start:65 stop:673 length:609 start_codon:yes stop_codon:yes gene_type:complete